MIDTSLKPLNTDDHARLDNPAWFALTEAHRSLALGGPLAYRFPAQMAPFSAIPNLSAQALHQLRQLVALTGPAALLSLDKIDAPPGLQIAYSGNIYQMIATRALTPPSTDVAVVELSANDVPDMLALARLTQPGPFGPRTHELGIYLGIRVAGTLVAMSGERMHLGRFSEISAVCVHPDFVGRGYARLLFSSLAARITARGEMPFLHVFTGNKAAISLYESCGFDIRRHFHVTGLSDASPSALAPSGLTPAPDYLHPKLS